MTVCYIDIYWLVNEALCTERCYSKKCPSVFFLNHTSLNVFNREEVAIMSERY